MELAGHSGEVFAARFDPTGRYIASGSMDRNICQSVLPGNYTSANAAQCSGELRAHARTTEF